MNKHSTWLRNYGRTYPLHQDEFKSIADYIDKLERERDEWHEVADGLAKDTIRLRKAIEDAPCKCYHIVCATGEKHPIPAQHMDLHDPRCWKREALGDELG